MKRTGTDIDNPSENLSIRFIQGIKNHYLSDSQRTDSKRFHDSSLVLNHSISLCFGAGIFGFLILLLPEASGTSSILSKRIHHCKQSIQHFNESINCRLQTQKRTLLVFQAESLPWLSRIFC
ncbi:hypothetical protein ASPZODRAFT_128669 [Penicilliopsis zonata CBS 506.65]|uniref:Uncharacterized protein n=1 Tax=Penicilliopsis zonata CBS 506.65 TaxID=1073090 RepID=A0A1L9SSH4_9EURO|nr:hypothetical protein ASPZODRAFT_128669 [Penicilliopsis zonata CBS 506.65]OJJ50064.1 hypothetical protein ASPZODRAFT_128669 [Penicilliopsis zonata CBS 506.65]